MIRVVETSRGLLVFALPGSWGDYYEVGLMDADLQQVASDEAELLAEDDLLASLLEIGLPEDEARRLVPRLLPEAERSKPRWWRR